MTLLNSFYNQKKVLVTGGCGFIGSHISEMLHSFGARITILDNLSTGNLKNITAIQNNITFIEGDIRDLQTCITACAHQDIVFHCAAFISVPLSLHNPQECHTHNIDGTQNLLEAARLCGTSRFIFSSSAAVYGQQEGTHAETTPAQPSSPYGFSKLIGEILCKQYAQLYTLHAVCLRYFNVYGPRQNPEGPYAAARAKFYTAMENNRPITIFGDGLQTRDFVPVEHVAHANLLAGMQAHILEPGALFNIACGKSVTLLETIAELKKKFPLYTGTLNFAPERPGDVKHSAANCQKFIATFQQFC